MTPIEELNEAINELVGIKKRAEERYQEAQQYLHRFKDIDRYRDLHINEMIMIGLILGYKPGRIRDNIQEATGDKDERIATDK